MIFWQRALALFTAATFLVGSVHITLRVKSIDPSLARFHRLETRPKGMNATKFYVRPVGRQNFGKSSRPLLSKRDLLQYRRIQPKLLREGLGSVNKSVNDDRFGSRRRESEAASKDNGGRRRGSGRSQKGVNKFIAKVSNESDDAVRVKSQPRQRNFERGDLDEATPRSLASGASLGIQKRSLLADETEQKISSLFQVAPNLNQWMSTVATQNINSSQSNLQHPALVNFSEIERVDTPRQLNYTRAVNAVALYGLASVGMGMFPAWKAWQSETANSLARLAAGKELKPFKLLIAVSVSASEKSIGNVLKWARYFQGVKKEQRVTHGFEDVIHFGLNHYDSNLAAWQPFMKEFNGSVALVRKGLRCKVMLWYELKPTVTDNYDYIWLVDDDLDTTFLDWNLMRMLLILLRPLVAQTAIAPVAKKKRSSDYPPLKMKALLDGQNLALAVNENIAEVMAPILSAKLWPLIHKRLESFDQRSAWRFDNFWSKAATMWGGKTCGFLAPLIVIHASPLVHLNTRTIKNTKLDLFKRKKRRSKKPLSRKELEGCIRRYVGNNQKVDKFRAEIMTPKKTTKPYDLAAHKVLVDVVGPNLNCTNVPASSAQIQWKQGTRWTLQRISTTFAR